MKILAGIMCAVVLALALIAQAWGGDLPDPALTPGVTRQVSMQELCRRGSSKDARHVTAAAKRQVLEVYGIVNPGRGEYEIDHLISLELGGANDVKNLWPQSFVTQPWNAHKKDRLENRLHALVCRGLLPLEHAQREIATDWIKAYRKYCGDCK